MHERPVELAAAARQREQHGRVGLQPHAKLEPVDEDAGDVRALLLARGLLLDDRGEDQRILR